MGWRIEAYTGYKPISTFWDDFTIAEQFGEVAIRDTYKTSFTGWKYNYKMMTELSMVLNHKIWQHWENNRHEIAKVYDSLWKQCDTYLMDNLHRKELEYYIKTTD